MRSKLLITGIALVILGLGFYWFDLRPMQIRTRCNNEALDKVGQATKQAGTSEGLFEGYDLLYKTCIRKKGLKE